MKIIMIALLLLPTIVSAESVSKSEWSKSLAGALPFALCVPAQKFLSCYNTDKESCSKVIKIVTESCVKNLPDIPDILSQDDAVKFGGQVGQCVGAAYKIAMTKAGHKKDSCD